jgi:acetyl-CoA carboxylase biotin carboxylase subunit
MRQQPRIPVAAHDIRRVFVANRGEIAVRVIRACRSLGIESVIGISEADLTSLGAEMADEAVVIGPAPVGDSYLRADKIVAAALATACDAIHPGYGFLSERAHFARACQDAGLVFIGPSPEAIEAMGDKITAVALAEQAGVPRVPGSGALKDTAHAARVALEIGYPVLIKATAGGGGRGMRVVREAAELDALMRSAANEAQSAFGDPTLYLEKFIEQARHIEIQIMADAHGHVVHLGERECSTQRRHQKLLEEAPSPSVSTAMRHAMGDCAVRLTRNARYCGAGTVEFVVDDRDGGFYFLEMNTRIQVEHPVTEMVTGIDLVAEQIRVACGLPLSFMQAQVHLRGHAIECRINAEDAEQGFSPCPGLITGWEVPVGEGIRFDSHAYGGYTVPPDYDSLIGKLIVHANTRPLAIARMQQALGELRVVGPATTVPFHQALLAHTDFIGAKVTTRWVEDSFIPQRQAAAQGRQPAQQHGAAHTEVHT